MDVLARLRSDMDDAGREAHVMEEDTTDACLDILGEFIGGWEVKRARVNRMNTSILHLDDTDEIPGAADTFLTILVPRERKPSLLGAAERVVATRDDFENCRDALDALAEAIEKEKSDEA